MKYYSANVSVVSVRRRDGLWATRRQARFLSRKLVWLFGMDPIYPERLNGINEQQCLDHQRHSEALEAAITRYLIGDREADIALRKQLTVAEYRIVSEAASFLAVDDEGSNAPDAYLAIDLNTGRNLVLRPR